MSLSFKKTKQKQIHKNSLPFIPLQKSIASKIFFMFLKEVSYAHQDYIDLIDNTANKRNF